MTIKEKYRLKKFADRNPVYGDNWLSDSLTNVIGDSLFSYDREIKPDGVTVESYSQTRPYAGKNDKYVLDPKNLFIAKDGPQAINYINKGSPWVQQLNKDNIAQSKRLAKYQQLIDKDKSLSWFTSPQEKFKVQRLIKEKAPIVAAGNEQMDRVAKLLKGDKNKNIDSFLRYADFKNQSLKDEYLKNIAKDIGYGAAGLAAGGGLVYLLHKLLSKKKNKKNKVDENLIKSNAKKSVAIDPKSVPQLLSALKSEGYI